MSIEVQIVLLLVLFIAGGIVFTQLGKKNNFQSPPAPPNPVPQKPDVEDEDLEPVEEYIGPVDRNGKREGEEGFDPRGDRPADEFSPKPPHGTYYGEGPFDPTKLWADMYGVFHRP